MGEKSFKTIITADDETCIEITTDRGRVVRFVVQYEARIDGKWYNIVRYDSAHGYAHRDTLDERGNNYRKDELGLTFDQAPQFAQAEIAEHWQRFRREFIQRMRGTQ